MNKSSSTIIALLLTFAFLAHGATASSSIEEIISTTIADSGVENVPIAEVIIHLFSEKVFSLSFSTTCLCASIFIDKIFSPQTIDLFIPPLILLSFHHSLQTHWKHKSHKSKKSYKSHKSWKSHKSHKSWKKSHKKSHKSWKKSHKYNHPKIDYLEADINDIGNKYDDISGWVHVDYDDGKLIINYHIEDGPEECDECKLAIYDGKKCKKIGDPHHDRSNNPWKVSNGAIFLSNKKGRAAGFFKLKTGYNLWRNRCKLVVLFDEDDKKIGCGKLIPEDKKKNYC
jgi:hypothetical protein